VRRALILIAVALVIGAALYQLLASQQGFVLVSVGTMVIEMSLWTSLLLVILAIFLVWLLRCLVRMLAAPRRWLVRRRLQRRHQQHNRTLQGFVDYIEGNWPAAIDNLKKSVAQSDLPAVNYLGAAAASYQLGDHEGADTLLKEAESIGVADGFATGLLRIRLALQERDYARACTEAEQLHRRNPAHPTVLRLLAAARRGLGDWQGLERMLRDLHKYRALSALEMEELEVEIHRQMLVRHIAEQPASLGVAERRAGLERRWHDMPRKLQKHPRLVAQFVRQSLLLGEAKQTEARLARYLNKRWDQELVELYGMVPADAVKQLTRAESWLPEHPEDAVLLRALGRLSARAELWGKARDYFEKSLSQRADAATCAELGELLARLGDSEGSLRCYRQGLAALEQKGIEPMAV